MIKGIHHVGICVASVERSLRFYCDLLGMEVLAQESFSGTQYDTILALSAARGRVALVRSASLVIELFEFSNPPTAKERSDEWRPVNERGITHVCVEVSDLRTFYERLTASGVGFHCPPLEFSRTEKATYARDPDGNVIELIEITPVEGTP